MLQSLSKYLRGILQPENSAARSAPRKRPCRPALECLERRDTPAITFHGGALLPNVEVQPMFYGLDWATNPTNLGQALQLGTFLGKTVNSSYMDMLTQAGYGVGRGTTSAGDLFEANVDKTQFLNDTQIRSAITSEIKNGNLRFPDANRLYVVFVEPNVAIKSGNSTSVNDFLGYHTAFAYNYPVDEGGLSYIATADVHYAVIAWTGGSIPLSTGTVSNATRPWLSNPFDNATETASHELAEAVTDANIGYKTLGWNDDIKGENGDLSANETVWLNGYAVQRIADQNGQAMTPMGAASAKPVDFVLMSNGTFWVHDQSGFVQKASSVASISDQGVDNLGQAMVDLVFSDGSAYEFHEGSGMTYMATGVKQAKASQGASYLLMNDGTVSEFKDWGNLATLSGTLLTNLDSNVQSIDAGTDKHGVNMFTEVRTDTLSRAVYINGHWTIQRYTQSNGYEVSDSGGKHSIASNVQSMGAGQMGNMTYITTSGGACSYNEGVNTWTYLGTGITTVTVGTDANGLPMLDVLYANGNVSEWRNGIGWVTLTSGITSIGKAHGGVVGIVSTAGIGWTHSDAWYLLTFSAKTVA